MYLKVTLAIVSAYVLRLALETLSGGLRAAHGRCRLVVG